MTASPTRSISLVLVRHAETPWVAEGRFQGQANTQLSPHGEEQARIVARRLADPAAPPALPLPSGDPIAIWHSPLHRTTATAHAIAGARREMKRLITIDDLVELDAGQWEGRTLDEIAARWPDEFAAWRHDPTKAHPVGGESVARGAARVRRALSTIIPALDVAAASGPAWGIVVSHDGVLRLTLRHLLALPGVRQDSFPFAPASVTVVERTDSGAWRLRAHGVNGV